MYPYQNRYKLIFLFTFFTDCVLQNLRGLNTCSFPCRFWCRYSVCQGRAELV